ncbi:saxitoxin and tetrodotoxin-binding protein 1-like isoform X1 [Nothobranchius furzeri]|uniref:saxitoxin and tetrodotoxin-binding protein 1-like isoform X1 n=1 Tax=Nothobranchius furzeri TaxID=105023 RepID=UPI0039048B9F
MCLLKGPGLLLLLLAAISTNAAPTHEHCSTVTKRMPTKHLHRIFGEWVLVWSEADHEDGHSLLANCSSSHVEFKLLPGNKTFECIERNVYKGSLDSCTTYYLNMTIPTDDAEHHTLKYDSIKREGAHRDVEHHKTHHDDLKKLAECLKFPHDRVYTYDGLADFCHKESAPEASQS